MKLPSLKYTLFTIAALGLGAFVVHNTKDIFIGAPFSIRMVKDGTVVLDPYFPIEGVAKHAAQVHINGRAVTVDQEGKFSDGVLLSPGYNMVTITQEDKFGNQKERVLHVVAEKKLEPDEGLTIHYQDNQ